jgi:hypothetical protein
MLLALALACSDPKPAGDSTTQPTAAYPLDDVLRVNDLQALGTHNSYHLRTEGIDRPEWDYDHLPLERQLGEQGVRQFELDLNFIPAESGSPTHFEVFHIGFLDENTTCRLLVDCLATMRAWSDAHPGHHPLVTLLEVKDPWMEDDLAWGDAYLARLEEEIASVWPRDRLLTPDDVQRDAANLREGIAAGGWPTLGETRGKAMFVMHTGDGFRARYTADGTAGKLLFPDAYGDTEAPFAAYHSMNDPLWYGQRIAEVVAAGHLVRTRADGDGNEARANDTTRRDAALASGAHFLSTDFPAAGANGEGPHPATGYFVAMPAGTPSRCNPVRAPEDCTPEAIESPALLGD